MRRRTVTSATVGAAGLAAASYGAASGSWPELVAGILAVVAGILDLLRARRR